MLLHWKKINANGIIWIPHYFFVTLINIYAIVHLCEFELHVKLEFQNNGRLLNISQIVVDCYKYFIK